MREPRRRFTVRQLMGMVAVYGFFAAGWAWCLKYPESDRDVSWFACVLVLSFATLLLVNISLLAFIAPEGDSQPPDTSASSERVRNGRWAAPTPQSRRRGQS